ncbi:DUF4390 domain-containing protein [Limnohabitans sp. Jir72]|uniref:DUF4390 domain-containing protein n=1 Tax=Limnohabitans sp. Jir72 TaxID=1977909 RepID=UPI000D36AFD3|nr:DUF4390 domain-containing protein [Limnohabitans sp. Jir72]PUE34938.1 hypothetical protein B9Z52_03460 [Limnohabitans sp. Jir72]
MTGFITHCWKSAGFDLRRNCRWLLWAWLMACAPVWAQTSSADMTEFKVERQDGSLLLNAQLKLELGPAVEDALIKGLAVHFVAEAEVMRDRWYWYDKKLGTAARYYRLAFQPLTRRWRLNVSSEPIAHSGVTSSLSQNFESLQEAIDVVRRQTSWKLADMSDIDPDARQHVAYRFRLDVSQLPRPFQIAAGNQADWRLEIARSLRLSADMVR